MEKAEYERLRVSFLRSFASVPDSFRNEIIVIIDEKPYNWDSAFIEVKGGTEKSKKILKDLKKFKIID